MVIYAYVSSNTPGIASWTKTVSLHYFGGNLTAEMILDVVHGGQYTLVSYAHNDNKDAWTFIIQTNGTDLEFINVSMRGFRETPAELLGFDDKETVASVYNKINGLRKNI